MPPTPPLQLTRSAPALAHIVVRSRIPLPNLSTVTSLLSHLSKTHGPLLDVRFSRDPSSRALRNYGFVTYLDTPSSSSSSTPSSFTTKPPTLPTTRTLSGIKECVASLDEQNRPGKPHAFVVERAKAAKPHTSTYLHDSIPMRFGGPEKYKMLETMMFEFGGFSEDTNWTQTGGVGERMGVESMQGFVRKRGERKGEVPSIEPEVVVAGSETVTERSTTTL